MSDLPFEDKQFLELRSKLRSFYDDLGTWEKVAKYVYQDRVSKALLWKIVEKGHNPKDWKVRKILGLPMLLWVPVDYIADPCPICNIAHTYDCTTERPVPLDARVIQPGKPRKRAPRIAVSKTDPVSGAQSLRNNLLPEALTALVRELLKELELPY